MVWLNNFLTLIKRHFVQPLSKAVGNVLRLCFNLKFRIMKT